MFTEPVKLRLTLFTSASDLYSSATKPSSAGAKIHAPRFVRSATYSGRAGRPEWAPKPSIRASVPSSAESLALMSRSRA